MKQSQALGRLFLAELIKIRAPGSVLLLGEYAITMEGAQGISIAVFPEVTATWKPNGIQRIVGSMGSKRYYWTPERCDSVLFQSLVSECGPPTGEIEVDSSSFVGSYGKLGLGSSAAVAVVVAALLLWRDLPFGNNVDIEIQRQKLFETALSAHRAAQGGSGSGYDVATSVWGGSIRVIGGDVPTVSRYQLPKFPEIVLIAGADSFSTPSAVSRFEEWYQQNPEKGKNFILNSQTVVEKVLCANEIDGWCDAIKIAGELVNSLGKQIGIAVEPIELRNRLDKLRDRGWSAKPVGAGGELAVAIAPSCRKSCDITDVYPLKFSLEGLRWLN